MLYINLAIPLKGLLNNMQVHSRGDSRYCYTRIKIKNKKSSHRCCVGKIETIDGIDCLVPNDNYFEFIAKKPAPLSTPVLNSGRHPNIQKAIEYYIDFKEHSIFVVGYCLATLSIAKEIHLYDAIVETFGENFGREILGASSYFTLSHRGSMDIEKFSSRNMLITNKVITNDRLEQLYQLISERSRYEFFAKWMQYTVIGNYCYDVTSVSSYSINIPVVSFGYNRDKEKLPQFNIGMFCDIDSGLPILFEEYDGAVNDFTNLPYVIDKAERLGLTHQKTIILDGGFAVSKVIQKLSDKHFNFIIGAPLSSFDIVRQEMIDWMMRPNFYNVQVFYCKTLREMMSLFTFMRQLLT